MCLKFLKIAILSKTFVSSNFLFFRNDTFGAVRLIYIIMNSQTPYKVSAQGRTLGETRGACLSTIGLLFSGSAHHQFGLGRRNIWSAPKAPVKSWRFFHLINEVYLVKNAFASENLENFSPPAGYFFVQHF